MAKWKPWEVSETRKKPDIFKPWQADAKERYENKPPDPNLVELTPEDLEALKAKRPRRTRLAKQAANQASSTQTSSTANPTAPPQTTEKKK